MRPRDRLANVVEGLVEFDPCDVVLSTQILYPTSRGGDDLAVTDFYVRALATVERLGAPVAEVGDNPLDLAHAKSLIVDALSGRDEKVRLDEPPSGHRVDVCSAPLEPTRQLDNS